MINEVMYDPDISDNYYEWIELFNPSNDSINLSDWILVDNSENESIEGDFDHGNGSTIIPAFGYCIITDHGTKIYENNTISNDTVKLYVDDSSIGNSLGNSGDKLILKNETGKVIDDVEWIIDYEDVNGSPAGLVLENHSLSRCNHVDTNNSSNDFYDSATSTPGGPNIVDIKPSFDLEMLPEYVPKVEDGSVFGFPFSIKINITNYPKNSTYQLKSYIIGNNNSSLPATQTWNGTNWEYSTYYTSTFTTDNFGNWSGWQYLRFKKDYSEYEENIKENFSAILKVKIRKENSTDELSKTLALLDMDDSTTNATPGGYVTGVFKENNAFLERKTVIVENALGNITGIYLTEDNGIDEDQCSIPGYFKISSTVGSNYTIKFLDEDNNTIKNNYNITIKKGFYKVEINSSEKYYQVKKNETKKIPLIVKNLGDFSDFIDIKVKNITGQWNATLDIENINLNTKEETTIFLYITPCKNDCLESNITIQVTSENDIAEIDEIILSFKILGPDLIVKELKIYDEEENETYNFFEGEILKIKAVVKNIGNENASCVNVTFYYDYIDEKHIIENKEYESIDEYQKYPSVTWDTKDLLPGIHTIYIVVDEENKIEELHEDNNEIFADIKIQSTHLSDSEEEILIVEVFYYNHPRIDNDFITLYNPTNETIDISGWYITKDCLKTKSNQTKIIFPNLTKIDSKKYLFITENASAYTWETGKKPDFEYNIKSRYGIPQMIVKKNFTLGKSGEVIALKDFYNHTIDIVVYGKCDYNESGWTGPPIPGVKNGILLKRNIGENGTYIDTNSSIDWINQRIHCIGQSDFPSTKFFFYGELKVFVSPDSSYKIIVDELRNATDSIYLNIYEFTNPALCDELINAILRDVSVNILLEGSPVGGITDEEKYILNRIESYGGNIRFIVNDVDKNIYKRYVFDHGKYLIIDNETVIVESCNWAKTGIPRNPSYGNREWGVVIRNESVADYFLDVFLDDWNFERFDIYSFSEMNFKIAEDFYLDDKAYYGYYQPKFESETFIGNSSCTPVFSPDTSYKAICDMIDSANESIYVEQLYIYKNWDEKSSPFVERLIKKSKEGIDVKVIMNYNPSYDETNDKCNETKQLFDESGVQTKFIYSNWSIFSNIHNKGMIVDNKSVLISSINWNENSVLYNREAGVIIENQKLADYYTQVFLYDWSLVQPQQQMQEENIISTDYKNTIYIVVIFTMTFTLIIRDWRKRRWT